MLPRSFRPVRKGPLICHCAFDVGRNPGRGVTMTVGFRWTSQSFADFGSKLGTGRPRARARTWRLQWAGLPNRAKDRFNEIVCGRDTMSPGAPSLLGDHESSFSYGHDENIVSSSR